MSNNYWQYTNSYSAPKLLDEKSKLAPTNNKMDPETTIPAEEAPRDQQMTLADICFLMLFVLFVVALFSFIIWSDAVKFQIPRCVTLERSDLDDLAQKAAQKAVTEAFKADSWFGPKCSDKTTISREIVLNFVVAMQNKPGGDNFVFANWNCIIFDKKNEYGMATPLRNFAAFTYDSKSIIIFNNAGK